MEEGNEWDMTRGYRKKYVESKGEGVYRREVVGNNLEVAFRRGTFYSPPSFWRAFEVATFSNNIFPRVLYPKEA